MSSRRYAEVRGRRIPIPDYDAMCRLRVTLRTLGEPFADIWMVDGDVPGMRHWIGRMTPVGSYGPNDA